MATPVQQGIEMVKKATELDRAQKYNEAVLHYEASLELFQQALQFEMRPENKVLIETKIEEYDKRCSRLKELLLRHNYKTALEQTLQGIVPEHPNASLEGQPSGVHSLNNSLIQNNNPRPLPNRPSPSYVPNHLRPGQVNSNPGVQPTTNNSQKIFSVRNSDGEVPTATSTIYNNHLHRVSDPGPPPSHTQSITSAAPIVPPRHSKKFGGLGFWVLNKKTSNDSMHTALELFQKAEAEHNPAVAAPLYKQAAELMLKYKEKGSDSEPSSISTFTEHSSSTSRSHKEVVINFDNRLEIQLHEILGGGGSGAQIYRASYGDPEGLTFAAKVMKGDMVPEMLEPIKREIQIMESLDNEHIVKYLGHDITDSEIRLYMSLYSSTLHDEINRRRTQKMPYKATDICKYMFLITKGLNYLHSLNPPILHRDLKSENIFVQFDSRKEIDQLKIGDFDSSKILQGQRATFTRNMGTDGFMAPEVASSSAGNKDKGYTKYADVWSLGMIMYELMMFEKPYFDVTPVNRHTVVLSGKRPTIHPEVERRYKDLVHLWQKCTEKDPSKRPETKKILKTLIGGDLITTTSTADNWPPAKKGTGFLVLGKINDIRNHHVQDSSKKFHRYLAVTVSVDGIRKRQYNKNGDELETNFNAEKVEKKGFLNKYDHKDNDDPSMVSFDQFRQLAGKPYFDYSSVHPAAPGVFEFWGPVADMKSRDLKKGDKIQIKTIGDTTLIESCANESKVAGSSYGGEDVLGGWTSKMNAKPNANTTGGDKPLPGSQLEGVADEEWD
ncbi:hypothetical protein PROFUN_06469 [Planoprotostelium fungivorum]|uniref:Serine/threonine-protein kinase ULK3 n=1 Tax=Planoprotostelium fungivorum TaxID=1890364 RepID=A0A2P6MR16_9EUKA|nr:hypothetical protein PROFUN_06469 [Planoprotostelium fungivorum]